MQNPLHSGCPAISHSFASYTDQNLGDVQFGPKLNTKIGVNLHNHKPTNIRILKFITRCDFGPKNSYKTGILALKYHYKYTNSSIYIGCFLYICR